MTKIISIIPARKGSKGIPNKNLINLSGKPLIHYAIQASKQSIVEETWVSSDSDEILNISKFPIAAAPINPQMFGNAGREHNEMYGSNPDHFAAIGEKNHRHSINNPYSQFRDQYTHDEIKASRMIYAPLTKLQLEKWKNIKDKTLKRFYVKSQRSVPLQRVNGTLEMSY